MTIRLSICFVAIGMVAGASGASVASAQEQERTYRSETFSVTWDEGMGITPDPSDENSDGIPDAVVRLLSVFEEARRFLLDHLGYREPPGRVPYPLYVVRRRGYVHAAPGGAEQSRASYIAVPAHLVQHGVSGLALRAFAVHEYMHAIQYGYNSDAPSWIMEATAAWVEDLFIDEADPNHRYVRWFVPYPRLGLTSVGEAHEYGAFLFLQFLTERVGGGSVAGAGLVRELWERLSMVDANGSVDRLDVTTAQLAERGWTFEAGWAASSLYWRWKLRSFEEGTSVPGVRVSVAAAYREDPVRRRDLPTRDR